MRKKTILFVFVFHVANILLMQRVNEISSAVVRQLCDITEDETMVTRFSNCMTSLQATIIEQADS